MSSFLTDAPDNVWMDKGFLRNGLWRAKVLNNVDSQGRGRIQIRSYHLHPEPLPPSGALESVNMGGGRPDEALGDSGEVVNRTSQQGIPDNLCPWAEPCFTGDTKISLLNGTEVPIKDLVGLDEFWVYSCTPDGKIVPGRGHSARLTKKDAQLVKITLDNGESVKCTPEHRFMMRDGTYREAKDLKPDDSLMPLYKLCGEMRGNVGALGQHIKQAHKNHKVSCVEHIGAGEDVYDITVDTYHNFAVSAGVFVHNCFPFGGNTVSDSGFFMLPEIGSTVWVAFEMGFVGRPVWLGSWLGSGEVPTEASGAPQFVRIIKTPMGHLLMFSDDDTNPFIQIYSKTGHQLLLDEQPGNQAVTLQSAHGHIIKIDENLTSIKAELFGAPNTKMELLPTSATLSIGANSIVITSTGVTITINGYTISLNNAGDTVITGNGIMRIDANGILTLGTGAVKGVALASLLTVLNTFINVFNTHVHTAGGPTSGPEFPAGTPVAGVPGVGGVDTSTTVLART